MRNLSKYLSVLVLIVLGCEDETLKQSSDQEFFPLRKGFYQIYSVTETIYPRLNVVETYQYQLKTEVVDSFMNELGGYTYTLHRNKRNTASDDWEFQQVWSVRMNTANVVVSEENVPFIKIVFPAIPKRMWNGNALNTLPEDEYILGEMGKSFELPDQVVKGLYIEVIQENSGDFFNENKRKEVYVRNIGLVYRESIVLEYCSDADECDITQHVIDNGTVYVQSLLSYGQN